ncbi:hypothetical protein SAMN04487943_10477 [Gracilibacillus orientalis]|uniref:Gram-positive cocci surface proteins LPxTG domain-containing protein n=1 Tax=Gracilibacillus orientalis TaxID=334253 RepID=A0A1I4KPD0_9BACI|nr:hypothetical protein [Gracilibacillus orientalis]SFL80624.1 hypothetical protein SAMN04487943_10477 [Gracilibacillus orientalis]
MVYLGWGIDDEGIAWMNEVLSQHPDRTAILTFHEYLQATGTRHPLGEKLYQEVVLPNENVVAVLSGHYHEAQTLVDEIDDDGDGNPDRTVYQMLSDYQAGPEGGQGYMRLLHFDTENNRIFVNTYSPYMDDYNYYDTDEYPNKDEFMIDLDLTAQEKRVATDNFAVNVYTNNEIGTVEDVASGDTAEATWTDLTEGEQYSWYATVSDDYTGESRSPIWSFVKGEDDTPDEEIGNGDGNQEEEQPGNDPDPRPDPSPSPDPDPQPNPNPDPDPRPDQGEGNDESEDGQGSENKNDQTTEEAEQNNNQQDESDADQINASNNNKINLPDTATNMYQYLALSLVLLLSGTILYVRTRRQKIK